jgi:dihydroorotase (multifunctional complex type)
MDRLQTLVINGEAYVEGRFIHTDIGVRDGKVVLLARPGEVLPPADTVIDATGLKILPGLIDTHVHMREPGFTHKEDITTATMAAAAGGVTLAVDMPNVRPSINSLERLVEHKALAATKSIVDFNHWPGPPQDLEEIGPMMAEGVLGIKVFMMNDTKRSYPHMPELGILNDGHLYDIFRACQKYNAICAVHPHNQELFEWIEQRYFWKDGKTGPEDYCNALRYGDSIVYDTAFATLLILARSSGVKLHMLHLNTFLGTQMVEWAWKSGVNITAEMNAPHFFITMEDVRKRGPYVLGTWTPPKDQKALWDVIGAKTMPFTGLIGTDHAPHHIDEKEVGWKDMWKAHGGAPYVQDYLSLFLNAVNEGRVTLERIVEITSEIPAKVFGFYPRKGAIRPGADADFAIVDMNKERIISKDQGYSKCGYNPFEGWKVKGNPVITMVRGSVVMKDGQITGAPGYGQFVPVDRDSQPGR